MSFGERSRAMNPRNWSFWQFICGCVRDALNAQIKLLINRPNKNPVDKFKLTGQFQVSGNSDLELSVPEPSYRDPPKGFVPLPDTEIGGCARNDSLIAPAIN